MMRPVLPLLAASLACDDGVITELTVDGVALLETSSPATQQVEVTGKCGGFTANTLTADDGSYELTANVENCDYFTLAFEKESFLPVAPAIPVPPPTSPLSLSVSMPELSELLCGSGWCTRENSADSTYPPELDNGGWIRGWGNIWSGPTAANLVGGAHRDQEDNIVWISAFGYFDFRDRDGARLAAFDPFRECFQLEDEAADWLIDQNPDGCLDGADCIEMNAYTLDTDMGIWRIEDAPALIAYTGTVTDEEGNTDSVPIIAPEWMLADIRAGIREVARPPYWVCPEIRGSGWYAVGVAIHEKQCVALNVESQCEQEIENVFVDVRGHDHGFRAWSWTDGGGDACVEVGRSEPEGRSYDDDEFLGETAFVDVALEWEGQTTSIEAIEVPRAVGSCAARETCVQLDVTMQDLRCAGTTDDKGIHTFTP